MADVEILQPGDPRLQGRRGTESRDNPFQADGELAHKADYILSHSLFSRTEIRVSDPDLSRSDIAPEEVLVVQNSSGPLYSAPPPSLNGPHQNGDKPLSPGNVQVEVGKANAATSQPQQAEQVKVKDKKCACCVVM